MIYGNGLIARAFKDYYDNNDIIIFASGVSNSKETKAELFNREIELLRLAIGLKKKLVYFSTISLDQDKKNYNLYLHHKHEIEKILLNENALIFRLPQVVGFDQNINNLIPFLYHKIKHNAEFYIYKNAERNLIDISDVRVLADFFISKYQEYDKPIPLVNPKSTKVSDLVSKFEFFFNKKARYKVISKNNFNFSINLFSNYLSTVELCNINFNENYNSKLLKKYYFEKIR